MKMVELKRKAMGLGINVKAKARKGDLIRQIQKAEGSFDCFGSAADYGDQWNCSFREDCLPTLKS